MAVATNIIHSFTSQSTIDSDGITGTPAFNTTVFRTGVAAVQLGGASETIGFDWTGRDVTDQGDGVVFGFWFRVDDKTPSTGATFCSLGFDTAAASGNTFLDIRLETQGNLILRDDNASSQDTVIDPLTENKWHLLEVYCDRLATGSGEWFLDDVSLGTFTGDFLASSPDDIIEFLTLGSGNGSLYIDCFYLRTGATAATDRFGIFEVWGFWDAKASVTPDAGMLGSAATDLDADQWADVFEAPWNTGTNGEYQSNGSDGTIDPDLPLDLKVAAGQAILPADGDIKVMQLSCILDRDGGSGSTHTIGIGNSGEGDSVGKTRAFTSITQSPLPYYTLTETAADFPDPNASNESIRMGMSYVSGGRDLHGFAMLGDILFVPTVPNITALSDSDLEYPDQNYFVGPFED